MVAQTRMPRPNRAYIFSASVAFVPHPAISSWWVRTHPAVLLATCPNCKASPGHLCERNGQVVYYTHYVRRRAVPRNAVNLPSVVMLTKTGR